MLALVVVAVIAQTPTAAPGVADGAPSDRRTDSTAQVPVPARGRAKGVPSDRRTVSSAQVPVLAQGRAKGVPSDRRATAKAWLGGGHPAARSSLPLFAMDAPDLVGALGAFDPQPGAWVEYRVRAREGTARIRFSVLGREGARSWLEMAAFGDAGVPFAARLLLGPGATRASDAERAVVYVLGLAPLELPVADLREHLESAPRAPEGTSIRRGRPVNVTVPAGRFQTEEMRIAALGAVARLWRCSQVPLWGLVRARSASESVELVAYGLHGARSAIPDQGTGSESTNE